MNLIDRHISQYNTIIFKYGIFVKRIVKKITNFSKIFVLIPKIQKKIVNLITNFRFYKALMIYSLLLFKSAPVEKSIHIVNKKHNKAKKSSYFESENGVSGWVLPVASAVRMNFRVVPSAIL